MTKWVCVECRNPCRVERKSNFPPERCIYVERGNDTSALWKEVR